MTIAVRRATAADAGLVSELNADVQAIHAAAMPYRFKKPGPDTFPPSEAASLIARSSHHVFIAEIDDAPAGYACAEVVRRSETTFHHAFEMIYLQHISVRPAQRKRGVGEALVAAVRACGREQGITLMTAEVYCFNEAARAFFRRQGFTAYTERIWDRSP